MPIKFLLLGGGSGFFGRGGWKCQFYFYGRGDFSELLEASDIGVGLVRASSLLREMTESRQQGGGGEYRRWGGGEGPKPFWGRGFMVCLGNENSAQSFFDRSFWKSLKIVDVRAFGSWVSALKCLFSQDFDRPDRSFWPGYPRE